MAKNVVVAIGSFHIPNIPKISMNLPKSIYQIHSSEYKNPQQLPEGSVLVVGAGNSGIQIADDLQKAGRKVYLSLGSIRILPRRYRGKDCMLWMNDLGMLDTTVESLPSPEAKNIIAPLLYGRNETVDLRKIAKEGVSLVGRVKDISNNHIYFEDSVDQSLKQGDETLAGFKTMVDQFIQIHNIDTPTEIPLREIPFTTEHITELSIEKSTISSIIWSTGYKNDYDWIKLPIFDKHNEPIHKRGVTEIPGMYFLGLSWLHKLKSFLLCGVAEDSLYISEQIN